MKILFLVLFLPWSVFADPGALKEFQYIESASKIVTVQFEEMNFSDLELLHCDSGGYYYRVTRPINVTVGDVYYQLGAKYLDKDFLLYTRSYTSDCNAKSLMEFYIFKPILVKDLDGVFAGVSFRINLEYKSSEEVLFKLGYDAKFGTYPLHGSMKVITAIGGISNGRVITDSIKTY